MAEYIEVMPAYGTDYRNQEEALAAWNAGKDFRVIRVGSGSYLSVRDVLNAPDGKLLTVTLRYGKGHREGRGKLLNLAKNGQVVPPPKPKKTRTPDA